MSRRTLIGIGSALALIVVVTLAIVFARGSGSSSPKKIALHGATGTPTPGASPAVPSPTATAVASAKPTPVSCPTIPVVYRPGATHSATPATPALPSTTPAPVGTGGVPVQFAPPAPCPTIVPGSTQNPPGAPAPTPHPAFVPGPLDGEPTAWNIAHRRPMAIMVENYSPDSRPQTGLSSASLIFETVAEFGITRFMPVYLENVPPEVGPIRSTRVYYDAWAEGMHAILVHAGGNDDALNEIWGMHDLADVNEVAFEDANYIAHVPFFTRSADRVAPHNLYAFPPQVLTYLNQKHIASEGDFPDALPHKNPDAPFHRPFGSVITINFSSPDYAVQYQYDHATNRYLRFMGGSPHVEPSTGHQLAPSNVVVLTASIRPDPNGGVNNPGAVYVQETGKNVAYYYRDGKQFIGTWHKSARDATLKLLDSAGHPFVFDPGQIWIEVLPTTGSTPGSFSYTPGKY
jgi:hypothetical protein